MATEEHVTDAQMAAMLNGGLEPPIHKDDIEWFSAPVPPRSHKCWAQTRAFDWSFIGWVERCACGAINMQKRYEQPHWMQRNTREGAPAEIEPGPVAKKSHWWKRRSS